MGRLLFIIAIVFIVIWLFKSYRRQLPKEDARGEDASGQESSGQAEDMVRCVHCGVHLPKRESILSNGKFYCSDAHRRLHAGKSD